MKKTKTFFVLLPIFFLVLPGALGETSGSNVPLLFIENPAIDAGTLVEGAVVRHTFLLQNRGGAPLVIDRTHTDCSCTQVHHDAVVHPDRNSYLRVVLDTAGQAGEWTKIIRIFSNDPLSPETRVSLTAHVLKAVKVEPDRVFFNGVTGNALDQTVTVKAPDERPFSLTLKQSRLSDQVGFYIESRENYYLIHIRNRAETAGISRGRIFFATDIPHRPLITIPVFSRIQEPLAIFPSEIDFGRVKKPAQPDASPRILTRSVNLKSADKNLPEIKTVRTGDTRFRTCSLRLKDLGILRIEVFADLNKMDKGKYVFYLEVEVNSPEKKTVRVPVGMEVF